MFRYSLIAVFITIVGAFLVLFIAFGGIRSPQSAPPEEQATQELREEGDTRSRLVFGDTSVLVEIVSSVEDRTRGLSGRESLADGTGMLFVMEREGLHGFWMPDMHFAIDIVWLDADLRVVDVKENATPESYPEIFKPKAPALYVLEVPAGYAGKYGIRVGVQAEISR